jgi:hypothetical protein
MANPWGLSSPFSHDFNGQGGASSDFLQAQQLFDKQTNYVALHR